MAVLGGHLLEPLLKVPLLVVQLLCFPFELLGLELNVAGPEKLEEKIILISIDVMKRVPRVRWCDPR